LSEGLVELHNWDVSNDKIHRSSMPFSANRAPNTMEEPTLQYCPLGKFASFRSLKQQSGLVRFLI